MRFVVVYPAQADGSGDLGGAPYPTVLKLQGGLVRSERYHWLAAHLASRGYVTVLPEHDLDLAIFEPGNGLAALEATYRYASLEPLEGLTAAGGPSAVAGHSLGGVVGAMTWLEESSLRGLVLLASHPPGGSEADLAAQDGRPVLALAGETDGALPPGEMEAELAAFPQAPSFAVVQGMNHYAWCDDASERELEDDGPLEGDLNDIRLAAQHVMDSWLDAELLGEPEAQARLEARDFEGVRWP